MAICDGYSRFISFDGRQAVIRPVTPLEEKTISQTLLHFSADEEIATQIIQETIWKKIEVDCGFETWMDKEIEFLFRVIMGWNEPEVGAEKPGWLRKESQNLFDGVYVAVKYPKVATRSCADCKKWWYNEDTGKPEFRRKYDPEKQEFQKIYLKRPEDSVTLCETRQGCPKGNPDSPIELSPRNKMAWDHYRQCKATNIFPNDAMVAHNAAIISRAIEAANRK